MGGGVGIPGGHGDGGGGAVVSASGPGSFKLAGAAGPSHRFKLPPGFRVTVCCSLQVRLKAVAGGPVTGIVAARVDSDSDTKMARVVQEGGRDRRWRGAGRVLELATRRDSEGDRLRARGVLANTVTIKNTALRQRGGAEEWRDLEHPWGLRPGPRGFQGG